MAKRQNLRKCDSEEVQGEGSWVVMRQISHGENKATIAKYGAYMGVGVADIPPATLIEMQEANDDLIVKNVVEWNWVDDNGDPLPLPRNQPDIVDALTEAEAKFLGLSMRGETERKK